MDFSKCDEQVVNLLNEVKELKRENLSLHESVETKDDKIRQLQLDLSDLKEDYRLKFFTAETDNMKIKE